MCTGIGRLSYQHTRDTRQKIGLLHLYDPTSDGEQSDGNNAENEVFWNPLQYCREFDGAREMASTIVRGAKKVAADNPLWRDAATHMLATHLFAAAANGYTITDVVRWIVTKEQFEVRSLLQATGVDEAISLAESCWSYEATILHSVYAAAGFIVNVWDSKLGQKSTQPGNSFRASRYLDAGADTLYLLSPPASWRRNSALTSQFVYTVLQQAFERNAAFNSFELDLNGAESAIRDSRGIVQPTVA